MACETYKSVESYEKFVDKLFVNKSIRHVLIKNKLSKTSEFVFDSRGMAFSFCYLKILQLTLHYIYGIPKTTTHPV